MNRYTFTLLWVLLWAAGTVICITALGWSMWWWVLSMIMIVAVLG